MADTWHVTSQRQSTELTPQGTFVDVWEVAAVSDRTGEHVTVRVPAAQYTPENVAARLQAAFDTHHAVADLTGG